MKRTIGKLDLRKAKVRSDIQALFWEHGQHISNKTVDTRELLEFAIRRSALYKYQKVLLLTEVIAKTTAGELK